MFNYYWNGAQREVRNNKFNLERKKSMTKITFTLLKKLVCVNSREGRTRQS